MSVRSLGSLKSLRSLRMGVGGVNRRPTEAEVVVVGGGGGNILFCGAFLFYIMCYYVMQFIN